MISVNQLIRLLGRQNPDALVVVAQDDQPETQANDITVRRLLDKGAKCYGEFQTYQGDDGLIYV